MKVLVLGSGGREHALVWKIGQSPAVDAVFCIPGNAGIAQIAHCSPISLTDFKALSEFVKKNMIDLTVVGPEAPLVEGIVDFFQQENLKIVGPNKKAAQFEGSKIFAKQFLKKYTIPTARYESFTDYSRACAYIESLNTGGPLVVKADGLAAGKGVIICADAQQAKESLRDMMETKVFGSAGQKVVIEEFLDGEEASIMVFMDGKSHDMMLPSQDHKRLLDKDLGPNTGGMGAYAPAPVINTAMRNTIETTIIAPIMKGLKAEHIEYKGVLYIGLMIAKGIPYVLEFNCRFGDPETQVVLPLLKTDIVEVFEKIVAQQLDKIKIEWYNKTAVCVVLASAGYPGLYEKGKIIQGIEKDNHIENITIFHAGTTVKDGQVFTAGGRVLGITGTGKNIHEAIQDTYDAIKKITFDGMQFRKDIAQKAVHRKFVGAS